MINKILIPAVVALVMTLGVGYLSTDQSNLGSLSEMLTKTASLEVTGGTILAGDLVLNQSAFCIDLYATSTATRGHITASTTATIEGVDGVMMFAYGSCQ